MDLSNAAWLVVLLALIGANLPFANERCMLLIPAFVEKKPFWVRLLEMAIYYSAVGFIAWFLEGRIGTVFPQKWEFYAVTICLFIVLAFPGFVYSYLTKNTKRRV